MPEKLGGVELAETWDKEVADELGIAGTLGLAEVSS